MRAGPFSSKRVIRILNASFVPVYVSNQTGGRDGAALADRLHLAQIQEKFERKGLEVGQVWVYILSPRGEAVEALHVAEATDETRLLAVLKQHAQRFENRSADPVVQPRAGARPPDQPASGIVLHLASRGWRRGTWREFPVESWITLSAAEVETIIGGGPPSPGVGWVTAPRVSRKILTHFYPATEDSTVEDRNEIETQRLTVRVLSADPTKVTARLDGELKMRRAFYPGRPADQNIEASIAGFVEYDPNTRRVLRFRLAAHPAAFGNEPFDVAVREHSY